MSSGCQAPASGAGVAGGVHDVVAGSQSYDPAGSQTISASTHHMAVDYSCYEGMQITGRVERVFSRGRQIVANGAYTGSAGHGRFVARQLCQAAATDSGERFSTRNLMLSVLNADGGLAAQAGCIEHLVDRDSVGRTAQV